MLKRLSHCGKLLNSGKVIFILPMAGKFTQVLSLMETKLFSQTYMTRVENENTRLRHYLARLHRKTLCSSKTEEMRSILT